MNWRMRKKKGGASFYLALEFSNKETIKNLAGLV